MLIRILAVREIHQEEEAAQRQSSAIAENNSLKWSSAYITIILLWCWTVPMELKLYVPPSVISDWSWYSRSVKRGVRVWILTIRLLKTNRDNIKSLGLWESCIYWQIVVFVFSSGHSYAHSFTVSLQTSDAVRNGKGVLMSPFLTLVLHQGDISPHHFSRLPFCLPAVHKLYKLGVSSRLLMNTELLYGC